MILFSNARSANIQKVQVLLDKYMTKEERRTLIMAKNVLEGGEFYSMQDAIDLFIQVLGKKSMMRILEQWTNEWDAYVKSLPPVKYRHKETGELYDGLDDWDNPDDYEKIGGFK